MMSYAGGLLVIIGIIYGFIGGFFAAVAAWLCIKKIDTPRKFFVLWFIFAIIIFSGITV